MKTSSVHTVRERMGVETASVESFGAWWTKPWCSPCSDSTDPFPCHFDLFLPVYCFSAISTFNLKTGLLAACVCCPGVSTPHLLLTPRWLAAPAGCPGLVSRGRLSQTSLNSSLVTVSRQHHAAKSCTGRDTHVPLLGAQYRVVIPVPTARAVRLLSCFICHLPLASWSQ